MSLSDEAYKIANNFNECKRRVVLNTWTNLVMEAANKGEMFIKWVGYLDPFDEQTLIEEGFEIRNEYNRQDIYYIGWEKAKESEENVME